VEGLGVQQRSPSDKEVEGDRGGEGSGGVGVACMGMMLS